MTKVNNLRNPLFEPEYLHLRDWKLDVSSLTGDYVAGLVQADGSFSAVLTRKTRGDKEYFNISLMFTLVQDKKHKDLILEIQKKWGGIGQWYLGKSDNTIRYQVSSMSSLLSVVIPFFMKHQLRGGKLISFLKFKYIAETMATRVHWGNRTNLLSLIVIANNMNPLGKLGSKLKYLTPEEQKHVIENIQPSGVDISKLTESIENFKQNELTLEFIHGLVDGDGSLSVSLTSVSKVSDSSQVKSKLSIAVNFTIVQDSDNLSLLDEIKNYFNGEGSIYEVKRSGNCSIYTTGSKSALREVILPKLMGKETREQLNSSSLEDLKLPLIKYNKIICTYKMLEYWAQDVKKEKNKEIIELLYYIRKDDNTSLDVFMEEMKEKLRMDNL